ncbi:MAG: hypothetical protein JSU04_01045 [Bdellovibrionales bacterium]|nr:hypothetical protein [Bdellovibrionales bacterium]
MKTLLGSLTILFSSFAFAHPGGHTLTCKSAKNSGAKQAIEVSLHRSNGKGWYAPTISVKADGKNYVLDTSDDMDNYGDTFHNSPLGVIHVTANNYNDNTATTFGSFSVVGIPSTVRAFDDQGHAVKYDLKAQKDQDGCYDSNGKARFQGVIEGQLKSNNKDISIETQILDCELVYDSGMAC